MAKVQTFKELSKGGIVTLVVLSVLGGYTIAHPFEHVFDFARMGMTLLGILLLASGSSALNQIQDAAMDARMERTRMRPIPRGDLSIGSAGIFVAVTVAAGLGVLTLLDRRLGWFGLAALGSYNVLYTLWWKRRWAFAAVPGAIPGALPIWMGALAASRQVWTPGAVYLFAVVFFWQMPHFWSLALRYAPDYRAGGVPTLPVVHGARLTLRQIAIWCAAYLALLLAAPLFLGVGRIYLALAIPTCVAILWELIGFLRSGFGAEEKSRWLRFFLWINVSLILFLIAAAVDLWSVYLFAKLYG